LSAGRAQQGERRLRTICGNGEKQRQQRAAGEAKAVPLFDGALLLCRQSTLAAQGSTMSLAAAANFTRHSLDVLGWTPEVRAALAG